MCAAAYDVRAGATAEIFGSLSVEWDADKRSLVGRGSRGERGQGGLTADLKESPSAELSATVAEVKMRIGPSRKDGCMVKSERGR